MTANQIPGPIGPVEPPADMRTAALTMRQMFLSLVEAGFTAPQALQILGAMLAAAQNGGDGS